MSFEEFSKNVRWILRFQDKKSVEKFLSISDLVLGLLFNGLKVTHLTRYGSPWRKQLTVFTKRK